MKAIKKVFSKIVDVLKKKYNLYKIRKRLRQSKDPFIYK